MKALKYIIPAVGMLLAGIPLFSQTIYDANRYMENDLNGTARFVGMGGAMGALGGDISTMGTNPAGIGIYRSSDAMISFGFANVAAKATLNGTQTKTEKNFGSFDNVGFVLAIKQGDVTPLRFVNFGFNYSKQKSFDKNMAMGGQLSGALSQTDQMAAQANGIIGFGSDPYSDYEIGWLSVMGNKTGLISPGETTKPNQHPILDEDKNPVVDKDGKPLYYNYDQYVGFGMNPKTGYSARERGGLSNYDFNMALNLYDRFYFGATLGIVDVDYSRSSQYREASDDGDYLMENWFETKGIGVNFKVGTIIRATDNFRIGAAIHIPTFYRLTDYHGAILTSNIDGETHTQNTYKEAGKAKTEYEMTTPWKFNVNLGYTIGRNIALGAEYEYMDRSAAKLKYDDGVSMSSENQMIKDGLKDVHTLRLGAEIRVAPMFSLRAGYNYITAPIHSDAFKNLPYNSIRTDTEFSNIKSTSNYTFGFGYKGESFYADMAYKYQTYKEDFYAFDHIDLPATKVDNNRHQVMVTLGMRF